MFKRPFSGNLLHQLFNWLHGTSVERQETQTSVTANFVE